MALLEPPRMSGHLLVKIHPREIGLFRFLLEAHDNLALFTCLDRRAALLKVMFAPESRNEAIRALEDIGRSVELEWHEWPGDNKI